MNETEQRIKLAEFEGYRWCISESGIVMLNMGTIYPGCKRPDDVSYYVNFCPDYFKDLNAVHEIEQKLCDVPFLNTEGFEWSDRCEYMAQLERIVIRDSKVDRCNFEFYTAKAPQRCEALLRTICQWTETPQPERTV